MKKTFLIILSIIVTAVVFYYIGYMRATIKLNCCEWGEGCERNIDPDRCNELLGFPSKYTKN